LDGFDGYKGSIFWFRKVSHKRWKANYVLGRYMVRYSTFEYQYPSLYNIVRRKQATVATVLESTPLNVYFRRALVGDKLLEWNNLVSRLVNITLSESGETDTFIWGLTNRGVYSVRSFYNFLVNTDVRITNREIWRMKIPLKIKIFMWYIRIIYLVETGGVVNYAAFAVLMNLYNICSLNVLMQNFSGVLCTSPLIYHHQLTWGICSTFGV